MPGTTKQGKFPSSAPLPASRAARLRLPIYFTSLCLLLGAGSTRAQDGELGFGFGPRAGSALMEQQVQEQVEEQVEEQIVEQAQEQIEEQIIDRGELGFGSSVGRAEALLEARLEEQLQEDVEDGVLENIEDDIAETIEDVIVDSLDERVEDRTAEQVDELIAESVEGNVEESISESIEDSIAEKVEDNITESITLAVEDDISDNLTASVEETVENNVEQTVSEVVEAEVEESISIAVEDQLEGEIDDIIDRIESEFEIREDRIHQGQWLVMAEPAVFDELEDEGYLFDNITELPGMGLWLADVAAPSSFDISDARQGVVDVVGSDRAEVDLNHIYTAGTTITSTDQGVMPRSALEIPADTRELSLRMGMIDSTVDLDHPALSGSRVQSRSFAGEPSDNPNFHGTAIASIIAANTPEYLGLAPNAELYAAGVFENDPERGEIASTLSLIKALDWLISSDVDVVNVSLAGPPNRLLESALTRASELDILVVAAAGNGGPAADPMYPAAYPDVVAITAVDTERRVFRLANRGEYLDLAAPGVDLVHARAGGGYTISSGTSFAVPFAATAAARLIKLQPEEDPLAALFSSAEDLGPQGRDDIYGHGLLRLTSR